MPPRPRPSHASDFFVSVLVMFGGFVLGLLCAIATAPPRSGIAYALGAFMLPIGVMFGGGLWDTLGELNAIRRWIFRLFSARARKKQASQKPPSTSRRGLFIAVTCVGTAVLVGLLTAVFWKLPIGPVVLKYAALGLIYGGVCWRLICAGYLQSEDNL